MISCIDTVKKIKVAVMHTRVPKSSANDNFELRATTMIKMMDKITCFSILFFKACWHAINLDNSLDRVISITEKVIF